MLTVLRRVLLVEVLRQHRQVALCALALALANQPPRDAQPRVVAPRDDGFCELEAHLLVQPLDDEQADHNELGHSCPPNTNFVTLRVRCSMSIALAW